MLEGFLFFFHCWLGVVVFFFFFFLKHVGSFVSFSFSLVVLVCCAKISGIFIDKAEEMSTLLLLLLLVVVLPKFPLPTFRPPPLPWCCYPLAVITAVLALMLHTVQ